MPAAAGILFIAAWATGLAAWPSNLSVAASGTQVVAAYTGHLGAALTQYLLVEGVAAIALAIVVAALGRAVIPRGADRSGRLVLLGGLGAAVVSLVECALGVVLCAGTVPAGDTRRAGEVFDLLNRLDGIKMLALAALALAAVNLARRGAVLPRWLGWISAGLAAAMTASGVGYLLLNGPLTQVAAASLVLLLTWVTATGVTIARSR